MVVDGILGKESVEFFFLLDFRGLKGANTKTRKATQQQHNEDRFIEEAVIIMVPG